MLWHEQSWPKLAEIDKSVPVVIPLGACEQHGHHMPVFADTIQVEAVATRVEAALGDRILLAPTLWLGSSHHHKDYPGTISVLPSLYSQIIKSIAMSFVGAGFQRVFFLNGHGGNEVPGAAALSELVAEQDKADNVCLAFGSWWRVASDAMAPDKHGMTTPGVTHACEYETSLMLFLRPDLVQMNHVQHAKPVMDNAWSASEGGKKVNVFHRFSRLTARGNMGSPHEATAEKGRSMLEAVVNDVQACLKDFATWPHMAKIGPA